MYEHCRPWGLLYTFVLEVSFPFPFTLVNIQDFGCFAPFAKQTVQHFHVFRAGKAFLCSESTTLMNSCQYSSLSSCYSCSAGECCKSASTRTYTNGSLSSKNDWVQNISMPQLFQLLFVVLHLATHTFCEMESMVNHHYLKILQISPWNPHDSESPWHSEVAFHRHSTWDFLWKSCQGSSIPYLYKLTCAVLNQWSSNMFGHLEGTQGCPKKSEVADNQMSFNCFLPHILISASSWSESCASAGFSSFVTGSSPSESTSSSEWDKGTRFSPSCCSSCSIAHPQVREQSAD